MGRWDKKPFEKWNAQDWFDWQEETRQLIRQCDMIKARYIQYAVMKGWISMEGK
jgi:hypothetical protein